MSGGQQFVSPSSDSHVMHTTPTCEAGGRQGSDSGTQHNTYLFPLIECLVRREEKIRKKAKATIVLPV